MKVEQSEKWEEFNKPVKDEITDVLKKKTKRLQGKLI